LFSSVFRARTDSDVVLSHVSFSREQRNPRSLNEVREMAMPERFLEARCRIGASKAVSRNGVFILGCLNGITICERMATQLAGGATKASSGGPLPKPRPLGGAFYSNRKRKIHDNFFASNRDGPAILESKPNVNTANWPRSTSPISV